MRARARRLIRHFKILFVIPLFVVSLVGCDLCGHGGGHVTGVDLTPKTATVAPGGTVQFTMEISTTGPGGSIGSSVFSVVSGGGTVSPEGLFTAPDTAGTSVVKVIAGGFSNTATITVSDVPALQRQQASPVQLFFNGNGGGVEGGGKNPSFTLDQTCFITMVQTYHWTSNGKAPGTITLTAADGTTYGPYECKGVAGMGGYNKNAYWQAAPNVELPAGAYTIVDSDPASFSQNAGSKGFGMAWVFGEPR